MDSFVNANIDELVAQLSDDEKIALLGAPNWWNTTKVERLGIPAVRMSECVMTLPLWGCPADSHRKWPERRPRIQPFSVLSSAVPSGT